MGYESRKSPWGLLSAPCRLLPQEKDPEGSSWGRLGGDQSHCPTPAPPLSLWGPSLHLQGKSTDCSTRTGMKAPHGWGRGTAATKQTSPQLHLPLFPQNLEPSEHTVGSADQEYREEVWPGGGVRETVTDSMWKIRKL